MNEFELKLEVPASRLKALQKEVALLPARAKVLRAVYYDTPARVLRKHGLVLRVRKDGGRWVQTVKAESGRLLERLEDEVELGQRGPDAPLPVADAHRGSGVGKRLKKALGHSPQDVLWRPLFSTEVRRTLATVHEGPSTIEIALDRGRIVAGDDEVLLREIEFELKDGAAADAVAVARQWLTRHRLWLNPVSKFEKGLQLSSGKAAVDDSFAAKGVSLAACVEQMLRSSAELAEGHAGAELVHQLRVGIRRTRTLLRHVYAGEADPSIEPALARLFRALGRIRDVDHVLSQLAPAIRAAGGPATATGVDGQSLPSPASMVRSPRFQDALLMLVALAHGDPGPVHRKPLAKEMRKLRKQCLRDGPEFERLDARRQHRVRKRLKRLRYLAEYAAPLYPSQKAEAFINAIKPAQDALGLYNDEQTALAWYRERAKSDSRAGFAVGWLTARREGQAAACADAMRKFAKAAPFWKDD